MRPAVIVIDMINDFVTGAFKSDRAVKIIPNISALLDHTREQKVPIVYATDAHLPETDREFDVWGKHAEAGSWGADIADELKPKKGDLRVFKRKYSAFQGTGARMEHGEPVYQLPTLAQIRKNASENLSKLPEKYKRLKGAVRHPVALSPRLKIIRKDLISKLEKIEGSA